MQEFDQGHVAYVRVPDLPLVDFLIVASILPSPNRNQ
jgi:hypothetical protein